MSYTRLIALATFGDYFDPITKNRLINAPTLTPQQQAMTPDSFAEDRQQESVLPREADAFDHPVDFGTTPKLTLAGLSFVRIAEHQFSHLEQVTCYRNESTKILVMFAKKRKGDDNPEVAGVNYFFPVKRKTVPAAKLQQILTSMVRDIKKLGYPKVRLMGPGQSKVV